jgi:hypothetical protein
MPVNASIARYYLKVSGISLGLLLNFNEATLKYGIRRRRL